MPGMPLMATTVCLVCLPTILAGCANDSDNGERTPPLVTVATPKRRQISEYVEATGTTESLQRVTLEARVDGYVEAIPFEEGEVVKGGTLLFEIEDEPFQAALMSAKARLTQAEADARLAKREFERRQTLYERDATSEETLEQKQAQYAIARGEVDAARAAVRQARLDLQYTKIRAPFAGEMGEHLVDVGGLVRAQTTQLAVIEQSQPIYAYFFVDERDFLRLRASYREQQLTKTDVPLALQTIIEQDYPHQGRLDYRAPRVESGTGTIQARGVFPNEDRELIPGLFVRVRAAVGRPQARLLVDARAVSADQRGDHVWVVREDNTVARRPVKLGPLRDEMRVIREGISRDDRVVVNGLLRVRAGIRVRTQTLDSPTGGANGTTVSTPTADPTGGDGGQG